MLYQSRTDVTHSVFFAKFCWHTATPTHSHTVWNSFQLLQTPMHHAVVAITTQEHTAFAALRVFPWCGEQLRL